MVPASRDKKSWLETASEEVKTEHIEWGRASRQSLDSTGAGANGESKASASRIASESDSRGINSLQPTYEGNGGFHVCLLAYSLTELALAGASSTGVELERNKRCF